jgi:hypothetical protein
VQAIGLLVAGLLVVVASWPRWTLVPDVGLDYSWVLGLAWAEELGLHWGSEVVFTYGPLAYTLAPMAFSWSQVFSAALLFVGTVATTLYFAVESARTNLDLPAPIALLAGALGTTVAVSTSPAGLFLSPPTFVAILFGSVALLASRSMLTLTCLAVLLAITGHQKLSEALLALLFATLCAYAARGWRGSSLLLSLTAAAWLVLWLVLGQSLADIPGWIHYAVEISLGYTSAMSLEIPGVGWHYLAAVPLAGLLMAQAWGVTTSKPRRERICLLIACALALWLSWKAAFTRHDGHALIYTSTVIVVGIAMLQIARPGRSLWLGLAGLGFALITHGSIDRQFGGSYLHPLERLERVQAFQHTLRALMSEDQRRSTLAGARRDLAERYRIGPALRATLGNDAVSADPWDISALWAAGATWDPLPVFQVYSAYTPMLDHANAQDLRQRPRQLLRHRAYRSIDGRRASWDSPLYQEVVYCEYAVVQTRGPWQVLRPTDATRCGALEPAGSTRAAAGEAVPVPARPGAQTVVSIDPARSFSDRAANLLAKSHPVTLTYGEGEWRYAHGQRATRLLLNAPLPHAAFSDLPRVPHATLRVSSKAEITFEFRKVHAAN